MRAKELFPDVFSRHARAYKRRQDALRRQGGLRARTLLIEGIGAGPGDQVLDLACGPGTLTLQLAELVAPDGQAVGIDLAPGMLEVAQASAPAGLPVRFELMDIEDLRFPDASFDAATCAHGLQFCADLDRALGQARRVLRSEARFGATVPLDRSSSVGEAIVSRIAGDRLPPGPETPDRDRTRAIVSDANAFRLHVEMAGFRNVRVQRVRESHRWENPAELIDMASSWWVLAERLEQLSQPDREALLTLARQTLEAQYGAGPIESHSTSSLLFADV
ncbi:MAG TPA: methyltransferase domain-containing protein [Candidatus Limnocylindrales bacterium]|nr:methyltransferase domain-containing protein [Candidatus Limnocylindrales bacterium]